MAVGLALFGVAGCADDEPATLRTTLDNPATSVPDETTTSVPVDTTSPVSDNFTEVPDVFSTVPDESSDPSEPGDDMAFADGTTDDVLAMLGGTMEQAQCLTDAFETSGVSLSVFLQPDLTTDVATDVIGALDDCYGLDQIMLPALARTYADPVAAQCVIDVLGPELLRTWAVLDSSGEAGFRVEARRLIEPAEDVCGAVALASAIPGPGDTGSLSLLACDVTISPVVAALVSIDPQSACMVDLAQDPTDPTLPMNTGASGWLADGTQVDLVVSAFHRSGQAEALDTLRAAAQDVGLPVALPADAFVAAGVDGGPLAVWVPDDEHPFGVAVTLTATGEPLVDVAAELASLIADALP